MSDTITRHLRVRGRVQGVGYRNYIQYKAGVLNIRGWVRNRTDGSVEAVVQGNTAAVNEIIECAKRGPRAAAVTTVDVSSTEGEFGEFVVRTTE